MKKTNSAIILLLFILFNACKKDDDNFIPVSSVALNMSDLNLQVGNEKVIKITITPANATNKSVVWKSSNDAIATVSSSGRVTAVGQGNATITVTTVDGQRTDSAQIVVIQPVTGVELDRSEINLSIGETADLVANIVPENASNKNVTWKSSNDAIATVSSSGRVTAVAQGNATITVTTVDGQRTASAQVTVTSNRSEGSNPEIIAVTKIELNPSQVNLSIGETADLVANIVPENASNKNVTWESSNDAIATVSGSGRVTAVGQGNATITVTTVDGQRTASAQVTVTSNNSENGNPEIVAVTGVELNPSQVNLSVGETADLVANIAPENASNKNVTWESSNDAIATVSSSGQVTAVGQGNATITVTTVDGQRTDSARVTVTRQPTADDFTVSGIEPAMGQIALRGSLKVRGTNLWDIHNPLNNRVTATFNGIPGNAELTGGGSILLFRELPEGANFPIVFTKGSQVEIFNQGDAPFQNIGFEQLPNDVVVRNITSNIVGNTSTIEPGSSLFLDGFNFGNSSTGVRIQMTINNVLTTIDNFNVTDRRITINKVPSQATFPIKVTIGGNTITIEQSDYPEVFFRTELLFKEADYVRGIFDFNDGVNDFASNAYADTRWNTRNLDTLKAFLNEIGFFVGGKSGRSPYIPGEQITTIHLVAANGRSLSSLKTTGGPGLSGLTALRLIFSINGLSAIGDEVTRLTHLTNLYLQSDKDSDGFLLIGLPNSIGNMTNLEQLTIKGANIRRLPASIVNLSKLTRLDISGVPLDCLPQQLLDRVEAKSLFIVPPLGDGERYDSCN